MKRQRDEGLEAVRLVLQCAQLQQVVDAVFVIFDVAVQHRGIRFQADLVRGARRVEPLVAVNLVIADDVADAVGKDLRAAAGQRIHACVLAVVPAFRGSRAWRASRGRQPPPS